MLCFLELTFDQLNSMKVKWFPSTIFFILFAFDPNIFDWTVERGGRSLGVKASTTCFAFSGSPSLEIAAGVDKACESL